MKVKNAVTMMSRFGVVRRHQSEYRARVGRGAISFRDKGGRCGRLRVVRDDRSCSCRTVTAALRESLHQVTLLSTPVGLLSVRISRVGRALVPVAGFIITTIDNEDQLRVEWAEDVAGDDDNLQTAQAAIDGTMTPTLLLNWLERRGANIASFLRRLGDGQESRPKATAAVKDKRS